MLKTVETIKFLRLCFPFLVILFCYLGYSKSVQANILNLSTPDKQIIADKFFDDDGLISSLLQEYHGVKEDYTITKMNYLPIDTGYFCVVEYKTISGSIANFALTKGVSYIFQTTDGSDPTIRFRYRTDDRRRMESRDTHIIIFDLKDTDASCDLLWVPEKTETTDTEKVLIELDDSQEYVVINTNGQCIPYKIFTNILMQ
jgi:hypothetical protein